MKTTSASTTAPDIRLRDEVRPDDCTAVERIVASTGFFNEEEIGVAVELVDERLARGEASGYAFVFAERDGRTVGYACYGPIAGTVASYDFYWIAVEAGLRGAGIGSLLMRAVEERIAAAGGRRVYVETSSREQYIPTRAFYERHGYHAEATLQDFYAPGDGKVIYAKRLDA